MALFRSIVFFLVSLASARAAASREGMRLSVNPIRRVISMLQVMQNKIDTEGKEEKRLFDKFMCYCEGSASNLEKGVEESEAKVPQLERELEESTAEKAQLEADVAAHAKDRAATDATIATARSLREKEAAQFGDVSSEAKVNIAGIDGALEALDRGSSSTFLQTGAADALRRFALVGDFQSLGLSEGDREDVTAFLQQQQQKQQQQQQGQASDDEEGDSSSPDAGAIQGILKQMKETMAQHLAEAADHEQRAAKDFTAMVAAKTQEANTIGATIQDKTARLGQVAAELETGSSDLDDTRAAATEDKEFLAELSTTCAQRKAQWKSRTKTRSEELQAISDVIKTLNDEDALRIFKRALPSTVLLQTAASSKEIAREAREAMKAANPGHGSRDVRLDLISLALHGKKVSFNKVLAMVEDMVVLLGKEQKADNRKKAECESDLNAANDEKASLAISLSDLAKELDEEHSTSQRLADEIKELEADIVILDNEVQEHTVQRQEEHRDFGDCLAANHAASRILGVARLQLSAFYNREAAVARANQKAGLVADAVVVSLVRGGDAESVNSDGPSFLQLRTRKQPPPQPEMFGEYPERSEQSGGVLRLIDTLVKDLAAEFRETQAEETGAQSAYEQFISDAAEKRAADAKTLTEKASRRADVEASLRGSEEDNRTKNEEALSNGRLIKDLHVSCNNLLQTFGVRKDARASELKSLQTAMAVITGADDAFVQIGQRHRLLRRAWGLH